MAAIDRTAEGIRLRVRAVPGASRTEIAGIHGGMVRIRLAKPPVDGAANEELVRFLAERLSIPRSSVRLAAGGSGRSKVVLVAGVDVERTRLRLGV